MNRILTTVSFFGLAALLSTAPAADDPAAATIDLSGVVIQHGADISRSSADGDLIQASTAYDYRISGKVTGSGAFSFIQPGTDLAAALEQIDEGFSENLDGTIINPKGTLKFTVVNKTLKGNFQVGPIPASAKAKIVAGIDEDGKPKFSITGVSFKAGGIPVSGNNKITFDDVPESKCDILLPPASNLPQRPDLLFSLPKQEAIGNNVYAGQAITVTISPGHGATTAYLLLSNDGTLQDTFTFQGLASGGDVKISYFEGKTDVTAAVTDGTYTVSNVASRGGAALKMKIKVKNGANLEGAMTLRSSVPAVTDVINFVFKAPN